MKLERSALAVLVSLATGTAWAVPPPTEAPSEWWSAVQQQIAEEEYAVSWQTATGVPGLDAAWQAPNRAHDLRTFFTPLGIRVVRRTEAARSWVLGLDWIGYGRGGTSWPVPAASLKASGARVEYFRGALSEWYDNSSRGLKQGFVLAVPPEELARTADAEKLDLGPVPPGRGRRGAVANLVHVDVGLSGALRPVISEDGKAIDLEAPGGARVVHYAELRVTDAGGTELPAWFEGFAGTDARGVRIVIDVEGAIFPVTVDPLATSPAWTAEGDQGAARFGFAVGTAGDVNADGYSDVIVGVPNFDSGQSDEGRAYVFLGSASGLAGSAAWTAESNQASAVFGISVATAGDVNGDGFSDVIVGASNYDNGQTDEGRAYVYLGSPSGLSTSAAWTAESDQTTAKFGFSVSTAGDVNGDGYSDVIAGAYLYDNGQTDEGRAFVYLGSASGLSTSPAWTAESNQATAYFGWSVAMAGDVNGDGYADVAVGAYAFDNGQADEGRAYVYLGSAAGLAGSPAWTAEGDQPSASFGGSVATAGDVNGDGYADVVVGSFGYDNGQTDEGRAFVYLGSATGPVASPAWTTESDQASAYLGYSVSTAGDVNGDGYADVVVGAYAYDGWQTDGGRTFVFFGSGAGLSASAAWAVEGDQNYAYFGKSVMTAGDVNGDGYADVIVGADAYDNGQTDEGRAYVYLGSASGPAYEIGWTVQGNQRLEYLGASLGTAGDVNGDGFADIIVGAAGYNVFGGAFVYLGSTSGPASAPSWTTTCFSGDSWCGAAVASAGDVNGDGYSDVIVGAPLADVGDRDRGRAHVFLGSASGLATTPAWTAAGEHPGAEFGQEVATAGDVNGDGYSDVIVSATGYYDDPQNRQRVYVFLGSAIGLSATPDWVVESDQANISFGSAAATAGDVNADGYSDVIVGALAYGNGEEAEGRAYLYLGSATGLASTPAWTAEPNQRAAFFGCSVATAGDVNGDGYSDVIVGAYGDDYDPQFHGRAYVYLGSASGLAATPAWTAESDLANADFGNSVSSAGDVNADGYSDVILGARRYFSGQGRAFVYLGSASGLAAVPDWWAGGNQTNAYFGTAVATVGDVNGDGYSDVISGAHYYDTTEQEAGRADVFYGNGGRGIPMPALQLQVGGPPIAPLGKSAEFDRFRLRLDGRTPFGRGLVDLQSEVKPLRTSFSGQDLGKAGTWLDTGAGVASTYFTVTGLHPGTVYHWRARLLHKPSSSPFQPHGPWRTGWWNGAQEADLRMRWEADLSVSQTDSSDPVFEGQPIGYHVVVTNGGPVEAPATLTDVLPEGAEFVSVSSSQGSCARASGIVNCDLGTIGGGGSATIDVSVLAPPGWGTATNVATVSVVAPTVDPDLSNNSSSESTQVRALNIGDFVWKDLDGDGIQDAGEPGVPGVVVLLYDGVGGLLASAATNQNGYYNFAYLDYGVIYNLAFILPAGYAFAPRDQGTDDGADSDADPVTGATATFALTDFQDAVRWDAGLVPDLDRDGFTSPGGDCNDADPAVHPGATELCNGWDDDCDGPVDETCDGICDLPSEVGDEVDLTPTAASVGAPRIVWSGTEYGVAYSDTRDGNTEVYFARFDASFNGIGADIRVTDAAGSSLSPYVAWTGTEYGVAWQDDRDGNTEIYFTRLDRQGNKIGGDLRITNAAGFSQRPRLAWSGTSYGLLWNDGRDGPVQNYFVELDAAGNPIGTDRRITPLGYSAQSGRFDWNGSVYGVVYSALRGGVWDVWFQTLDRHGNTVTPEASVTSTTAIIRTAAIAWDGMSQFGISWLDNRSGGDQLFFTRIAADGAKLTGDHPLVALVSSASIPQMIMHSGAEWALTWIDQTVGNAEIYFGRVAGDALNGLPIRVTDDPGTAQNPALAWNGTEYGIAFAENRGGASAYHAYGARIGCCTVSTIGDRVWSDADSDGIQDAGEGGVRGALVAAYDTSGAMIDAVSTGTDGSYRLDGLSCGSTYELRFFPPGSDYLSPRDQGADDTLDSDADPVTGSTGLFVLTSNADASKWDAGIAACWPPDEPVYIYRMTVTSDGNAYPVIHFQDPNQPEQVTGYNVRRSSTAAPLPGTWPVVATDVIDMDEATPNKQWVDQSGDISPTGVWFYQVTGYNHACPAEGPF